MANSESQLRVPVPSNSKPPSIAGVLATKLNLKYLQASYAKLVALRPKTSNGAGYPHPSNLTTMDALVRAISNWMTAEGDPNTSGKCDNCLGHMDIAFARSKDLPNECVYCGDSPILGDGEEDDEDDEDDEDEDEIPDLPDDEDDEPVIEDEPPAVAEEPEEDDAAPESGKVAASTPAKKKVKKVAAKKNEPEQTHLLPGEKVDFKKNGKVAAKTKGGKLVKASDAESPQVIDKETRELLDGIETVRKGIVSAGQGFYDASWEAGKFLADIQKSKAWMKHPNNFRVWKDFVEGVFGSLINVKKVDELVEFYKKHTKEIPKLTGQLSLALLPKAKNPKPRQAKKPGETETSPAFDPSRISVAGTFLKKMKIALTNAEGKPSKRLGDRPQMFIKSDNGVIIKIVFQQKANGELVGLVTIDRE